MTVYALIPDFKVALLDNSGNPASGYKLTVAFIDIASGDVISSRQANVTNETPKLTGTVPQQGSKVFSEVYACRRGN